MKKPLMLVAAALCFAAVPSHADDVINNAIDHLAITQTQAAQLSADEQASLQALREEMHTAINRTAVRAALQQAVAEAYLARQAELDARIEATLREISRAMAQSNQEATRRSIAAVRRGAATLAADIRTWLALSAAIAAIDAHMDAVNARHREALIEAMHSIAARANYQEARDAVRAAMESAPSTRAGSEPKP